MAIKVSAKTVTQLRKGTMAGNLAKAKNASPEMKEALTRFYGAAAVKKAGGMTTSAKVPSTKRTGTSAVKPRTAPSAASRMDKPKAKATGKTVVKSASVFAPTGKVNTPAERAYAKAYNKFKSQGTKPFIDLPKIIKDSKSKDKFAGAKANKANRDKNKGK